MLCLNLIVFLLGDILRSVVAVNCPGLPTTSNIQQALETLVANSTSVREHERVTVTIMSGPFFTCQVQGTKVGTYQEVSLIVFYNSNQGNNISQFEMFCVSDGQWGYVDSFSTPGVDYTSISLWTNCSECVSNISLNENHCQCEFQSL